MNTSKTLKLLSLALMSLPLLAQAGNASQTVSHDGFELVGDSLIYVGHADSQLSRDAVRQAARLPAAGGDGFELVGDSLIFVGTPAGAQGKTRAQVKAELVAARQAQVSHDGWQLVGDSLVFLGQPSASADTRVAAQ